MAPYDTVRKHFRTLREREENSQKLFFWSDDHRPQDFAGHVSTVGASVVKRVVEALQNGQTHVSYKGWADCRICGDHLGSQDLYAEGYIWPSKAEHYILKHGVWTPDLSRFAESLGIEPEAPTIFDKLFTEALSAEEQQALAVINRKHSAGSTDEFWIEHRRNIKTAEFSEEFERWGGWDPDKETRHDAWRRYMTTLEFKDRQKRIFQIEDRETNKDGTHSCGVFIPLPYNLAKDFPDKSEHDDSVPHFTILYVGDCSLEHYKILCKAVSQVAKRLKPFHLELDHYSEFKNAKGLTIAHMVPGVVSQMRLAAIHGLIRRELDASAVKINVQHTYGAKGSPGSPYEAQFLAHATLAYEQPGSTYAGPKPTGRWQVNEIECWGHEKMRYPLGRIKVDQPTGLTRTPLSALAYPAAVSDEDHKDVTSARIITVAELRAAAKTLMARTGLSAGELLRQQLKGHP
jgi:2'-5' RNA ligase